jgi:peptide/nickel transport system substrate-binding protein
MIVTINSDLAKELKGDPKTKVLSVLSERVAYFQLNSLAGPTTDLRLRQAIAYAIDREAIVNGILGGYDQVVPIMLSPAHVGWLNGFKGFSFDPAKAKELIKAVGAPATQPMVLFTSPTFDQRIVQAIQQMLIEVGLKINIESSDFATWLKRAQSSPQEFGAMTFSRWSCGCQDADGVLFPLLYSKSQWAKSSDPKIDAELVAARSTVVMAERIEHYKRVHELVEETVPLVPLYQAAILYGARKELQWTPTPNESMFLNRMSWQE